MKKIITIFLSITAIAILVTFNTAMANKPNAGIENRENVQKAASTVTPEELKKASVILTELANDIENGNITPEIRDRSAEIMINVSHILDALANPDQKATYSTIRQQNNEVKKKWNPWDEMVEH